MRIRENTREIVKLVTRKVKESKDGKEKGEIEEREQPLLIH